MALYMGKSKHKLRHCWFIFWNLRRAGNLRKLKKTHVICKDLSSFSDWDVLSCNLMSCPFHNPFLFSAQVIPRLTPVSVPQTNKFPVSLLTVHQTHSVPVLNPVTQSIAISASVSHYKRYYGSSWSVPLVSALSNDFCGPFCSSTNHSCWNGEKSLEAKGNNCEKWSNSGAHYKSERHPSTTEGHKKFFLLDSRERECSGPGRVELL